MLALLSIGSAAYYMIWRCKYTRLGLLVPPLKKWQRYLLYSPMVLFILFLLLILWAMKEDEEFVRFEKDKDKNRYFTLKETTPFGEIVLPKGTQIRKYIPQGYQNNAPADLNDVEGIQFPYPVTINDISIIEIAPTTGFLRLAEDYHFTDKTGKAITCSKTNYLNVHLNNFDLRTIYNDKNLPIPPSTFKPSLWTFSDCNVPVELASPPQ